MPGVTVITPKTKMTNRQRTVRHVRLHKWELTTLGTSGVLIVVGLIRGAGIG